MSAQIVIGRRCPKTNENPVGWEEISLQNITFDKPTVLCLSGDGTLTAKDANAMAKYAEQLLGRKGLEGKDDIQILSAYYKNANAHEMTNSRLCLTAKDKSRFTEEEQNPSYIFDFYQKCIKKIFIHKNGRRRENKEAQKLMRNLNILNFCHGDYITCKLNEIIPQDITNYGWSDFDIDKTLKQATVISVVPQDSLKKSSFTKIGFAALDDYHHASGDATALTDYYELDCCESSCLGIIERPRETKPGRSRLFYIDNLLNYNSIDDKFTVWMGKTEKLHQMKAYIDLGYKNEFGNASENADNFARMISRALQNAVSNSCLNTHTEELWELNSGEIFKSQTARFRQGNDQQNHGYLYPEAENIALEAQHKGMEIDKKLYSSQTNFNIISHTRD